jgi:hypothetical protein
MNSFPTHSILVSSISEGKEYNFMREKTCINNPNQLIPFSFSLHIRENNELGINENQIPELTAYPNPADNSVNLRLNNGNIEKLFIYDLQGRVVFHYQESTNSKSVEVDLNDFQKGLYIIRVESHGGSVSSTKLIKR